MTEKQYGGANSFGFKDNSLKKNSGQPHSSEKSRNERAEFREVGEENREIKEARLSAETINNYRKAGEISQKIRKYIAENIKKGMLLLEIAETIEDKIEEFGGKCAFPVNLSLNEIAAHYTPSPKDETRAIGLLKVDFGVEFNGFIADSAMSFDFSESGEFKEMIEFNEFILDEALNQIEFGGPAKIIGNKISEFIEKDKRFRIIKNLSGHSLGKDNIHAGLSISNIQNENNFPLKNIAVAIEPFLTTIEGKGEIYEAKQSEIFQLQNEKRLPRDRKAREILEFIKNNYRTNPFCKRWLEKKGFNKINFYISLLIQEGILYNFPVLVERNKKPVSQAEKSILFFNEKKLIYT